MDRDSNIVLAVCFLVGYIHLSSGYGTKGGQHSFSQSYSSASASAHSSSFSSSGSFTLGEKSILPIVGPIPIANSAAVASASAVAAASGTSAVAGGTSTVLGQIGSDGSNSISGYGQTGVGSYGVSKPAINITPGGSTHIQDGSAGNYGAIGGTYTSQVAGSVTESFGKEKKINGEYLLRPPCCKTISAGPDGSIYDYKVPSHVNTVTKTPSVIPVSGYGQTGAGSYGVSKPAKNITPGGYTHTQDGTAGSYGAIGGTYTSQTAAGSTTDSSGKEKENNGEFLLRPPCCKKIRPGPDGSIYDYKVPSHVNTVTKTPSVTPGYEPKTGGAVGYVGENTQTSGIIGNSKKPCCKGPFPGPNGSIHDSKPASAVGTALKPTYSQETITPIPPLQRPGPYHSDGQLSHKPTVNKPVGNYEPSEPVRVPYTSSGYKFPGPSPTTPNTIVGPSREHSPEGSEFVASSTHSNDQYSVVNVVSGGNGVYQTNYQGTAAYKPSCNQGICTNQPPKQYLQPPQNKEKPIVENVQEQPIPTVISDSGNSHTAVTIKPGKSGYQESSVDYANKNAQKTQVPNDSRFVFNQPETVISNTGYVKPQESSYISQKPQNTPVVGEVSQKGDSDIQQGGYSANSFSGGSSFSSVGHSASGGVVNTQKQYGQVTAPTDLTPKKENEDRILYASVPESPSSGSSSGYHSSTMKHIMKDSGLREGPRGSPFVSGSNLDHESKKSDYDESKGDSAIVFIDRERGYTGRGYAITSDSVHSNAGGLNVVYSDSEHVGQKPRVDHLSTVVVGPKKPSSNQDTGTYGQGVIVIEASSTDKSRIDGTPSSYDYSESSVVHKDIGYGKNGQGVFVVGTYKGSKSGDVGSRGHASSSIGSGNIGQGVIAVGTSGIGHSGTYGYAGGFIGPKGLPCTSKGCGTSYRQYSNAIPSKHVAVHITSVPSGSDGSYASGGSYVGGGYGSSFGGSYGGTSANVGNEGGGFLSSIFLDDSAEGTGGSHSKAGSYAHSSSFAKASSYASSSSFSSASSGSYNSGHY